jgi:hypothetical protein
VFTSSSTSAIALSGHSLIGTSIAPTTPIAIINTLSMNGQWILLAFNPMTKKFKEL